MPDEVLCLRAQDTKRVPPVQPFVGESSLAASYARHRRSSSRRKPGRLRAALPGRGWQSCRLHTRSASEAAPRRHVSAQQANDSQVQRLLNRCQLGLKFPETRAEKFRSLVLQVRIRKLSHQYEQKFRVLWRGDAVYGLQVLQIRVAQLPEVPVTAPKCDKSHNDKQ